MNSLHWSRRQFVGAALTTSIVTLGGGVAPALAAVESVHRFALVQSTALPIDSAHIKEDLDRNLTRVLQIIEHHAKPHDWLVFDDAPLTGHAANWLAAADVSLSDDQLERLKSAARRHHCWISLGAVLGKRDSILLLSPSGGSKNWPMPARHAPLPLIDPSNDQSDSLPILTLEGRRIALVPIDAHAEVIAEFMNPAIDILITMGSGLGCVAPRASQTGPSLSMQVHAAAPWQPPGCLSEGLRRSRACNTRGEVIAECPTAEEHVLVLDSLITTGCTALTDIRNEVA